MDVVSATVLGAEDGAAAAAAALDEQQVNRVLLDMVRVGESHGIRFPRCASCSLSIAERFDHVCCAGRACKGTLKLSGL